MIPALIVSLAVVTSAGTPLLDAVHADSVTKAIEKEREASREFLKSSPMSYLATVGRVDFGARSELTVGRAPDNDVRLEDPTIAPHHLRVAVFGDSFHVRDVDDTARFTAGKVEARDAHLGPGNVKVGRFVLRLSHQRFPAIIVFDPVSPRFQEYKGIQYFPVDLRLRFVLALTPNPRPDTVVILSTRGNQRRAARVGWFEFRVAGTRCRLEASRLLEPGVGEHDLAVFFRDATTGRESYPVGRYLDPVALGDGRYVLDFNLAYNPACAYSTHYNCPIPPRANQLPVAIRAGEKDSHYLAH